MLKEAKWIDWGERIREEVRKCEELARLIGDLSKMLNLSVGSEKSGDEAKAEFYRQIDLPFRGWLENLNPSEMQENEYQYAEQKCESWHKIALTTVMRVADQLMENLGSSALVGRRVEGKEKAFWCCAPKAYNRFLYYLGGVYEDKKC